MKELIKKFTKHPETIRIFERRYTLTYLLTIYEAYMRQIEKECGCKINNVLVYKNPRNDLFEFFVNYSGFNEAILKLINSRDNLLHRLVEKYYQLIDKLKDIMNQPIEHKYVFNLVSRIMSLEFLSFIIPFLKSDMGLKIDDQPLVKKWSQARIVTEKLFHPRGLIDSIWSERLHIPNHYSGYLPERKEFLIFSDNFIYQPELIKTFRESIKIDKTTILKGSSAYIEKRRIIGQVKIVYSWKDFRKINKGDILVAPMTTPDYLPILHLVKAIITDEGGVLCHAAIVSRELKIPCIVGTQTATKILKDGDWVEIDQDQGIVRVV